MCPVQFERKIDPVAFLALTFSLVGLVYSAYGFTKGDELLLMQPEQVLIWTAPSSSGRELALFSIRLSCLNRGQPGYPGVIQSAWLWFSIADGYVEHSWQHFGYTKVEKRELKIERTEDAHPVGVEGGGVWSREVLFAPRTNAAGEATNFIEWNWFLSKLRERDHLDLNLTIDVFEEDPVTVTCRIKVTKVFMDNLVRRRWSAPRCMPIQ